MTKKGFYKLITKPHIFAKDYIKKKYFSKNTIINKEEIEKIESLISPIKLDISEIKSINIKNILDVLAKYIRIYGFSENNYSKHEEFYEYGVDSEQFRLLLLLLNSISSNGIISVFFVIKSQKFVLTTKTFNEIYNNLKKNHSFYISIKNLKREQYKVLFQIADIVDNFLIFRANNTLYKKQRFFNEVPDYGLIDLKTLNQHNHPSQLLWNKPVDIVYTWVNSEDENWRKMILKYKPEDELDFDRYQNFDELKYSLRSIENHAPWIRTIYIVTNCEQPKWLNKKHPKIKWVWHEDIFPSQDYLPTFSSHAIESCLHRIDGLSEYFIYFNDDVFLMKDMKKTDFFKTNDCSISFMEPYGMAFYSREKEDESYIYAALNGKRLLEKKFAISPVQFHKHVPHVLRKSILIEMEEVFSESYEVVRRNRFRDKTDISTISFLYHHYSYFIKESVRGDCIEHLIRNTNYRAKSRAIEKKRPHFVCINDGGGSANDIKYKNWMKEFLEKYYPESVEWEVDE